jgi:hypothetical protein
MNLVIRPFRFLGWKSCALKLQALNTINNSSKECVDELEGYYLDLDQKRTT